MREALSACPASRAATSGCWPLPLASWDRRRKMAGVRSLPVPAAATLLPDLPRRAHPPGVPAMLTFFGRSHRPDGCLSRRAFLRVGAAGLGALTLPNLLRLKARGAVDARKSDKAVI